MSSIGEEELPAESRAEITFGTVTVRGVLDSFLKYSSRVMVVPESEGDHAVQGGGQRSYVGDANEGLGRKLYSRNVTRFPGLEFHR
ncbi:hypothetical protein, partial [Streptococcus pneumoniae]|uniref:hypothetical protein n=1 Tax=Streptococcus pneumoniae TaxID=1313 RepID=UPI001CB7A5AC